MRPKQPSEEVGLYVHVPFCLTRCSYCDFFSSTDESLIDAWIGAVVREAQQASREGIGPVDTLYVGGGTPSRLVGEQLRWLVEGLSGAIPIAPGAEVTLEVNPDDVDEHSARAWQGAGIGRISLGVQSLDDEELRFLDRRHDAASARRAVECLRDVGVEDLGLDLIFALPDQSLDRWRRTLDEALALEPDHLSCYQLTLEPGTPLARRLVRQGLSSVDEEVQRAMFLETHARLAAAGFEHYEISNWARPGRRSRHNQLYWHHAPYRGLGPAAHSFDGQRDRWWNVSSVPQFVSEMAKPDGTVVAERERLTDEQLDLEALMLGLRTSDGIDDDLIRRFATGESVVAELLDEGLLRRVDDGVAPTLEGFLLADGLPARFW